MVRIRGPVAIYIETFHLSLSGGLCPQSREGSLQSNSSRVSRESIDKADSRFMPVVNNKKEKRKGEEGKREEKREKKKRGERERKERVESRRGLKSTLEV